MITELGTIVREGDDRFLKLWQVQVEEANRILREHRHINFEIAMVLSGEGVYHTVSGIHPMKPGDVFVFSGNEPHCITRIMPGGLELVNLHFNWQFFISAAGDRWPNMFFAHSRSFQNRLEREGCHQVRFLMEQIIEEFRCCKPQYEGAVSAYVNLLFVELTRNHGYFQTEEQTHGAVDKILQSVAFIDSHYTEDITLEQIAEKSGITPNYFTKLFRDCFHVKLWDYITAKRIDKAKRMLLGDSGETMLQIAESCGFHSTANFNRAFLKFTGITPSAYKGRRELLH